MIAPITSAVIPADLPQPSSEDDAVEIAPSRFLTVEEIEDLPDPEYLIPGVLLEGSVAILFGEPGIGKSFLALDIALHVTAGLDWCGKEVKAGDCLYIVAEGAPGQKRRIAAWRDKHSADLDRIRFLPEPVQMHRNLKVRELLKDIEAEFPDGLDLIVVDTLARCFVGGDENSAQDMGRLVDGLDLLRKSTGATVLVLHHTVKQKRKGGGNERGSSALRGAADTMVTLEKKGGVLQLTGEKQKDDALFDPIPLSLVPRSGSCVVVPIHLKGLKAVSAETLSKRAREARKVLSEFGADGATHTEWKERFMEVSGKSKSTFNRVLEELKDSAYIDNSSDGAGNKYVVTEAAKKR